MNQFMTYSAFVLGLAQIIFALQFPLQPGRRPQGAGDNPWHANTLEWADASPPPHYNFEMIPTVYHAAYEYSVPGVDEDYLPQTEPRPAEAGPARPGHGVSGRSGVRDFRFEISSFIQP